MTKRLLIQTITTNAGRALVPASQAADTEHHFQRSLFGEARRLEGLKLNIADGTTRGDHRLREASDGLQTLVRNMTEVAQRLYCFLVETRLTAVCPATQKPQPCVAAAVICTVSRSATDREVRVLRPKTVR
jgi:hypothetical protein